MQAFRQVGSFDALTSTPLRQVADLEADHRRRGAGSRRGRPAIDARPAGGDRSPRVEASVGAASPTSGFDRARLRRAVSIESMLAVAVVIVTSLLMAANPSLAAAVGAVLVDTDEQRISGDDHRRTGRVGSNEVHIYLSSPNSSLDQPDAVAVTIQDPPEV